MSLKGIFRRTRDSSSDSTDVHYGAVVDTSNDTVIAIGTVGAALLFLSESMMDTMYASEMVVTKNFLRVKDSDPRSYPEWSLDYKKWELKKTNPSTVTEDMRERAVLAAKKVAVISNIIYRINRLRTKIYTGLFFQENIYAEKERQARRLKDANFDERLAAESPYVAQYAEHSNVPLRQAAEEILFQAQLDHEYLAKTEKVRLSLFKKIRLAKTAAETDEIYSAFRNSGIA